MKRLAYIFIPVLAILLMSHNTFAINNFNPTVCYNIVGQGTTCSSAIVSTGEHINIISISRQNNPGFDNTFGYNRPFIWVLNIKSDFQPTINLANGYPYMADIYQVEQNCTDDNDYYVCNVFISGFINNVYQFNLQLAGDIFANGYLYSIQTTYFNTQTDLYNTGKILEYLQNNPSASAQDIASAIENTAEQNTQNAANDSQTAGSSSSQDATTATSSLISAIGGFVGAVTTASPTNCVVNFTTSQLTIGNMDLCANPVPAYVQIIGSIILICAAIPLAIVLFNRFIGLFRSFQG